MTETSNPFASLEQALSAAEAAGQAGTVRLVVARLGNSKHKPLDEGRLTAAEGLVGDRWSAEKDPEARSQITLMQASVVQAIAGGELVPQAGDNLLVDFDLSEDALPVGTRVRVGQALLEITPEPHTGCRKFSARFGSEALKWINAKENKARRLRGVHGRVVEEGVVRPGDAIAIVN